MLASFSAGVASISTVPAKGAGRSPDSQISAGARRNRVNEWDQPVVLVTVARQTALPSEVGWSMPWSCSTLYTRRCCSQECHRSPETGGVRAVCPNRLAHQPQTILGEPAIGGFRLVQLQLFLEQVAQPIQQLALQCVLGRGHGARRIAAKLLGHRRPVCLHDEFPQYTGMFVLTGQHIEQRCPESRIVAEPVQDVAVEQLAIEQACCGAVQAVFAVVTVAKSVRLVQRAMPRMPSTAVGQFDV